MLNLETRRGGMGGWKIAREETLVRMYCKREDSLFTKNLKRVLTHFHNLLYNIKGIRKNVVVLHVVRRFEFPFFLTYLTVFYYTDINLYTPDIIGKILSKEV